MSAAATTSPSPQAGFALLVLLGLIGAGSLLLVTMLQNIVPPAARRAADAEANLTVVTRAAAIAFRRQGSFPADLDALAIAGGRIDPGAWRRDPNGHAQELDYARTASGVRVRSRGLDRRLGTGDDVVATVAGEPALRARQRGRLRLLRSLLLRSPACLAPTMNSADLTAMREAMGQVAFVQRRWLTAATAERALLTERLVGATATITALRLAHGLAALPLAVTGAGGLMELLGTDDARAVDGAGAPLRSDVLLGVAAVGGDGVGGNDDDM